MKCQLTFIIGKKELLVSVYFLQVNSNIVLGLASMALPFKSGFKTSFITLSLAYSSITS